MSNSRTLASKVLKATVGGHADQVEIFVSKFQEIRQQFIASKAVDVEIAVLRVTGEIRSDFTDHGMGCLDALSLQLTIGLT